MSDRDRCCPFLERNGGLSRPLQSAGSKWAESPDTPLKGVLGRLGAEDVAANRQRAGAAATCQSAVTASAGSGGTIGGLLRSWRPCRTVWRPTNAHTHTQKQVLPTAGQRKRVSPGTEARGRSSLGPSSAVAWSRTPSRGPACAHPPHPTSGTGQLQFRVIPAQGQRVGWGLPPPPCRGHRTRALPLCPGGLRAQERCPPSSDFPGRNQLWGVRGATGWWGSRQAGRCWGYAGLVTGLAHLGLPGLVEPTFTSEISH